MSKSERLRLVPPSRTPEREVLAEAIAALAEARSASGVTDATVDRAQASLAAAQARHREAEGALAEARERAIGAVTATCGVQPPDLKELRRNVADALDDVDIAGQAVKRAEVATVDVGYRERKAQEALEETANAVLAADFDRTFEAATAAARKMARLAWIAEKMGFASPHDLASKRYGAAQCLNPQRVLPSWDVGALQDAARAEFDAARAAR